MLDPANVEQEVYREFARARRKEFFGRLARRLAAGLRCDRTGGDVAGRLDCFGEVREGRAVPRKCCRSFETVEVEKISGSVGRCLDFDRSFLPVCSCLGDRWRGVDRALRRGNSLQPVELYELDGEYFVLDGNHRVSVARYRGVAAVDAMVTWFLAPCAC